MADSQQLEGMAATIGGSRTFVDGVKITWTPSTTTNSVELEITIGGEPVWEQGQKGNGTLNINVSGENYELSGKLSVTFGSGGTTGQVRADGLKWTVQGEQHGYTGLVGVW
jgi:hypothetical protein